MTSVNGSFILKALLLVALSSAASEEKCTEMPGSARGSAFMQLQTHTATSGGINSGLEASRLYQPTVARTRVACVGDSITFGYRGSVDHPFGWPASSSNYPAFLQKLLGPAYEVVNLGESTNWVQRVSPHSYWSSPSFGRLTNTTWDVIVIMLGTNDARVEAWKPGCEQDFSSCRFVVDYNAMIRTVRNLGRVPGQSPMVLLMAPPPVLIAQIAKNVTSGINATIVNTVISQMVSQIAEANHLPVINIFEAFGGLPWHNNCSRTGLNEGLLCRYMCDHSWFDAVHPADEGFRAIGSAVAAKLLYG